MLQEMVARVLGVEPGTYRQFVGSMHLYVKDESGARAYLDEGLHRPIAMQPMPMGDPFTRSIPALLDAERRIRAGEWLDAGVVSNDPFWADLVRLLQAFAMTGVPARLEAIARELADPLYRPYIEARRDMRPRRPDRPTQLRLEL
jgi:thymidylate synthase